MILTGENLNTWRKTCPIATVSTPYLTWTDKGIETQASTVRGQ